MILTRLLLLYKAGLEGVRLFDEGKSVWDAYRGRSWPKDMIPEMTDVSGLDVLAGGLQQAKWRPSSRALYNGYFRAWTSFAIVHAWMQIDAGGAGMVDKMAGMDGFASVSYTHLTLPTKRIV